MSSAIHCDVGIGDCSADSGGDIDIAATGGVISELAPDAPPAKDAIGQANRLMVGLVHGVVFTEMYADSTRAQDMIEFCTNRMISSTLSFPSRSEDMSREHWQMTQMSQDLLFRKDAPSQ